MTQPSNPNKQTQIPAPDMTALFTYGPTIQPFQTDHLIDLVNAILDDDLAEVHSNFMILKITGVSIFDFKFSRIAATREHPPRDILWTAWTCKAWRCLNWLTQRFLETAPLVASEFLSTLAVESETWPSDGEEAQRAFKLLGLVASTVFAMWSDSALTKMPLNNFGPKVLDIFRDALAKEWARREEMELDAEVGDEQEQEAGAAPVKGQRL